ncbi:pyridoxine 5'-phosphate synthase [Bradyrhizobium sp. AZCC 1693]
MSKAPPLRLGVNVDHVATLRNARRGERPDPVRAALAAIEAGADGITAHLREDRRHIRDSDMARLKAEISKPLNFEMAATEDMLRISLATKPHAVCLVPERREELTTEGGLDVVGQHNALAPFIARLNDAGIRVSLFIAADPQQIEMAARLRAPVIEIHTGGWCDAVVDGHTAKAEAEWQGGSWRGPPWRAQRGWRSMPATASTTRRPRRYQHCPRSPNSTSAIS